MTTQHFTSPKRWLPAENNIPAIISSDITTIPAPPQMTQIEWQNVLNHAWYYQAASYQPPLPKSSSSFSSSSITLIRSGFQDSNVVRPSPKPKPITEIQQDPAFGAEIRAKAEEAAKIAAAKLIEEARVAAEITKAVEEAKIAVKVVEKARMSAEIRAKAEEDAKIAAARLIEETRVVSKTKTEAEKEAITAAADEEARIAAADEEAKIAAGAKVIEDARVAAEMHVKVEELKNQRRAFEEQMEEERVQHAAEIESEALKMQEYKIRNNRERAADEQKLVAMQEALVLKEQAAKIEIQRIEMNKIKKIKELQQQHEDVKKKMQENAKLEAELVQQEANDKKKALLLIETQQKQAELAQAETERIRLETELHKKMLEIAQKETERMTKLTLEKVEKEKKRKQFLEFRKKTLNEAWNTKKRYEKYQLGIVIVYRSKGGHIEYWDEQDPEKVNEWKDLKVKPVEADFNDWKTYLTWLDSVGQDSRAQLNHKLSGEEYKQNDSNNTSTSIDNGYQQQEKVDRIDTESEQERLQLNMQQLQHALPASASSSSFSSHNSMENGLKPYVHVTRTGSIHITYDDYKQEHNVDNENKNDNENKTDFDFTNTNLGISSSPSTPPLLDSSASINIDHIHFQKGPEETNELEYLEEEHPHLQIVHHNAKDALAKDIAMESSLIEEHRYYSNGDDNSRYVQEMYNNSDGTFSRQTYWETDNGLPVPDGITNNDQITFGDDGDDDY